MAKNRLDLDDLKEVVADRKTSVPTRKRQATYMSERQTSLNTLSNTEHKKFLHVDPKRCKIWDAHDRDYSLLNEESCGDLIRGIKSERKQQFPAIVRPVKGNPDFDWEVICGARRHWTISWLRENNYPDLDFLIEPRSLTDEEAFRLSDIENRDKEDLSDYERAIKYRKAVHEYHYYKTIKDMAARIEIDAAKLERFFKLAELPETLVYAFPSKKEIKVDHARLLNPFLNKPKLKARLLEEANRIREEQNERRKTNVDLIAAASVFKRLKNYASTEAKGKSKTKTIPIEFTASDGQVCIKMKKARAGNIELSLLKTKNVSKEEYLKMFSDLLEEHMQL